MGSHSCEDKNNKLKNIFQRRNYKTDAKLAETTLKLWRMCIDVYLKKQNNN